MRAERIKHAAKTLLPVSVQRRLRGSRALRFSKLGLPLSGYLDQWAAKRVLQAIIAKTDDVKTVKWLHKSIWQYPLDAWVIQEVIGHLQPDVIVETGTHFGGSAYFFACLCDLLNHGQVVSIDIAARATIPHPRITYLSGSSIDPGTVSIIGGQLSELEVRRVLIVLDSDHSANHVLRELEAYAPLVPIGSYIHVQDGCIDELPIFKGQGPGPAVAAKQFLETHPSFIRDLKVEHRYLMTAHPYGWLRRIAED